MTTSTGCGPSPGRAVDEAHTVSSDACGNRWLPREVSWAEGLKNTLAGTGCPECFFLSPGRNSRVRGYPESHFAPRIPVGTGVHPLAQAPITRCVSPIGPI